MNNSIRLAFLALCFYGLAAPFMKYVHDSGVSTRDFIFVASISTIVASLFWPTSQPLFSTLSGGKVLVVVVMASLFLTGGFISLNQALAIPFAIASVVFIISSANPLLGSLLNLFYMGESKKVILWMLITGSLFTVVGTILVVLSIKNS